MDFNFTSRICTAKEQSEKLLALGLKRETADCYLEYVGIDNYGNNVWHPSIIVNNYRMPDYSRDFPAWSLNRLIEMMPNNIRVYDSIASLIVSNEKVQYYFHDVEYSDYLTSVGRWKSGDIYDNIIDCIEWLIKEGYFNKEYLEEHLCGKR